MLINENEPNGPITVNKDENDRTKRNLFNVIKKKDDSFYYNYEEFNILNDTISKKSEYICELKENYRPEVLKGYDISCPNHYIIKVDKVFYGRYRKDMKHCKIVGNTHFNKKQLKIKKTCGYEPKKYIKELCEGKNYCTIIPTKNFFKNYCGEVSKYLYIEYHCQKELKLKKEKISIISFYNGIEVNSIQEHSVSEFYQYAKIHGYDFKLEYINYVPGREIYFMKFYSLIEKITEGLKYKKYDWIVWVDSDIIFLNPNIKLECFLPNDKMNKINLIAAIDYTGRKDYCCGLNTGVLFIRVNEWSLNILIRALSYPYFNNKVELSNPEQIALNNILIESNEYEHFVIVPQQWFNNLHIKKGEFLFHIMGGTNEDKNKLLKQFINNTINDEEWYSKTNDETRKEVLKYYELSNEDQIKIKIQP